MLFTFSSILSWMNILKKEKTKNGIKILNMNANLYRTTATFVKMNLKFTHEASRQFTIYELVQQVPMNTHICCRKTE